MEINKNNFNIRAEIDIWPYQVRKLFKNEILNLGLCTKQTFNQWRTYGIAPNSTSLIMVKKIIAKYNEMLKNEPLEITLSRSIA